MLLIPTIQSPLNRGPTMIIFVEDLSLLHSHRLGEIAGLIHIAATLYSYII